MSLMTTTNKGGLQPLATAPCTRVSLSKPSLGKCRSRLAGFKRTPAWQARWLQSNERKGSIAASTTEATEPAPPADMSVEELKVAFMDSLFGLDRGLKAKGEARAELNELIGQLESCNPTPSPTEDIEILDGTWRLVYTSSPSVLAVLRLSRFPLVKVGDITQSIDGPGMSVENRIEISVPFSKTSFGTNASFEVSSPKRLRFQVKSGNISTPELVEDIELPDTVSLMGQTVDLTPLKQALQPLNTTVKDTVAQLSDILSQQQDLKIPIQEDRAPVRWVLTSFLDEDTRISRGAGGTLSVFVKDAPVEEVQDDDTSATATAPAEQEDEVLADEPVQSTADTGAVVDVEPIEKEPETDVEDTED